LSATNSITVSTAAAMSTSVRCRPAGMSSVPAKRPSRPRMSTVAYALIPLVHPLVNASGSSSMAAA
jgi:hypothetical protein